MKSYCQTYPSASAGPAIEPDGPDDVISSALHNRISVWITSLGLGDTICSTPAIRRLHKMYPQHEIDVYTYYPEIFTYNKNVDSTYRFDEGLELIGHYKRLRLHGYRRYFQTFFSTENQPPIDHATTNIIDVCSRLALGTILPDHEKWLEAPYSRNEADAVGEKISGFDVNWQKAVVIHPSITWPTRTWPKERWDALTEILLRAGYQVIAVGNDKPVIERRNEVDKIGMFDCPPGAVNLIGKLSILETIALLGRSLAIITMDSGLLHMALCTNINIVGMFTVVHPVFRIAWRSGSFEHGFAAVPPRGECLYCSYNSPANMKDVHNCLHGEVPRCVPDVEDVYETFTSLLKGTFRNQYQAGEGLMQQYQKMINPDAVCQQAIQAKLNVYQAKEQFETVLKMYNDQLDNLVNLVGLMKNRVLELEGEKFREGDKKADLPATPRPENPGIGN